MIADFDEYLELYSLNYIRKSLAPDHFKKNFLLDCKDLHDHHFFSPWNWNRSEFGIFWMVDGF